ncbi:hypothetical protein BDQ17DRAFT_1399534 [Cyathus striatus]|nr:hypothetical protein BDQ17DRAFT_1399534 [Cyathus striatus]
MFPHMAQNWDRYTRQGIDLAHSASSIGFSAAKIGTRLGFSVARTVTTSAANLTTSALDLFLFGGAPTSQPAVSSALTAAFSFAESLTLAPIHFTEYLTSTSLLAAHSSINVLSVIFPGSSDASFSLASFIGLVRREWATPREGDNWPDGDFGITEIGRAIVAWVALQGVTQEWQEKQWFKWLKELDVNPPAAKRPELGHRRNSRIRVTSDVIFPGQGGAQIVSAVIGEAPPRLSRSQSFIHQKHNHSNHQSPPQPPPAPSSSWGRRSSISLLARRSLQPITPLDLSPFPQPSFQASATPSPPAPVHHPSGPPPPLSADELKTTFRRLSKMVLAGYGGASLLFFGVSPYAIPTPPKVTGITSDAQKSREEAQLTKAIDASEAEAAGDGSESSSGSMPTYSWWDVLLGRHDKAIFEHWADHHPPTPAEQEKQHKEQMKAKMKATAVVGKEHLMPRFWVLTDYNRSQIVLVLRGTMSLNEIAVDLTCEPVTFTPVRTPVPCEEDEQPVPGRFHFPGARKGKQRATEQKNGSGPKYHVHGGMLRMANAMGGLGKPVHLAVQEALHNNPDFELILCGHSLGAGVAALLGMMWADPSTCLTVPSSGLPPNRRVHVYCFGPPCLTDSRLTQLTSHLITSFVYSHDVISRLSLGTVRDLKNAAMWLCEAQKHDEDKSSEAGKGEGYAALTARAKRWKAGQGSEEDVDWFIAMRKTLEANMHNMSIMMYPPGRVFWGMRNGDLHLSHHDKLRLFEVLNPEKVFGEIIFARNMLTAHMPTQYDKVLHDLL